MRPATVLRAALLPAVLAVLIATCFLWPPTHSHPRDLPVAVAGPAPAVAAVRTQLTALDGPVGEGDRVIDVREAPDRAAAEALIRRREAYGALVLGPQPEVLVSTAASPAAAQLLTQVAQQMGAQAAQRQPGAATPRVTDVVPSNPHDTRGTAFAMLTLPLALGGMLTGSVIALTTRTRGERLLGLLGAAVLIGLGLTPVLQYAFHAIDGPFWANAGAVTLAATGIAGLLVGLYAWLGTAGIGLGAALTMLVSVPLAGISAPPEFLPNGLGSLGQFLVPGAAGDLLRRLSYFPDAATGRAWGVLAGWAALGAALVAARATRRTVAANPAQVEED